MKISSINSTNFYGTSFHQTNVNNKTKKEIIPASTTQQKLGIMYPKNYIPYLNTRIKADLDSLSVPIAPEGYTESSSVIDTAKKISEIALDSVDSRIDERIGSPFLEYSSVEELRRNAKDKYAAIDGIIHHSLEVAKSVDKLGDALASEAELDKRGVDITEETEIDIDAAENLG